MEAKEKASEIVKKYFDEPEKSIEEVFSECLADLPQEDADRVLKILKEIFN